MSATKEHTERIKEELRAVGVTAFGAKKFASRYLPNIIHDDEHICGAVYRRYREGQGLLSMTEGMLVATDHRAGQSQTLHPQ